MLRHEDRTQDATFFSPLTSMGIDKSKELIDILKKNNINYIYSSPFIRTLQTIHPYAKENDIKLKLEYGLSEIMTQDTIPKKSYQVRLPEYMAKLFNYDSNYKSQIEPEEIQFPENENNVQSRIRKILKYIIGTHGTTNNNILIVTHQTCNKCILKIVKKFGAIPPTSESLSSYPTGALTKIFDEKIWTFNPINWKSK